MSGTSPGLGKILVLAAALAAALPAGARGEAFTPEAAIEIRSVADPRLSPDGEWVVYQVSERDLERDETIGSLWMVPLDGHEAPRRLTRKGVPSSRPRFSPDGGQLAFLSKREGDEATQIYVLPLAGGEARRLTEFPGGVGEQEWSPDGTRISFVAKVYPDCETIECTAERDAEKKAKGEKGPEPRRHRSLLYRHWTSYVGEKVKHLFVVPAEGGEPLDLTPGLERDAVQWPLAVSHAGRDYDWSPDGAQIALAANLNRNQETNYDVDLYLVPVTGGEPRCITEANPAADATPRFSPDGRYLAYRSSTRPGYESDRYHLRVMDLGTGEVRDLTEDLDRQVRELWWGPRSRTLYFNVLDRGNNQVHAVGIEGGRIELVTPLPGTYADVSISPDGKRLLYRKTTYDSPYEVYTSRVGKKDERRLSRANGDFRDRYDLARVEEFWYDAADGVKIQGWILEPEDYDPARTYPVILGVHGGPQGMYGNRFHAIYQILAGRGYVVVYTNPRGSMGYGQAFTDQINSDWGGRVIQDLLEGLDAALERVSADESRLGATGWSYGGFVMNWLLGHTDRFRAILSGAGIANLWSFYGSTEELFFPEWDFGGTPWEKKELYDHLSPIRYAESFHTPTLFVHGDRDFRVPITEGEQMFTAMQRQGIPSEFLRFHDEGHWIGRPTNLLTLYQAYPEWFDRWMKPGAMETP